MLMVPKQFSSQIAVKPADAVALHCTLSSGKQWRPLMDRLGNAFRVQTPDMSGYGQEMRPPHFPATLQSEAELLDDCLAAVPGAFHLIGHSHGGATAFRLALMPKYARRIRSLTLIEPVLPGALLTHAGDVGLYWDFAEVASSVCMSIVNNQLDTGLDTFIDFWNGSGAAARLPADARSQMIDQVGKVAIDFSAIFAEESVIANARTIAVPTLILAGNRSPRATQQIAARLYEAIPRACFTSLAGAGHMLPITHAAEVNAHIHNHVVANEIRHEPIAA